MCKLAPPQTGFGAEGSVTLCLCWDLVDDTAQLKHIALILLLEMLPSVASILKEHTKADAKLVVDLLCLLLRNHAADQQEVLSTRVLSFLVTMNRPVSWSKRFS